MTSRSTPARRFLERALVTVACGLVPMCVAPTALAEGPIDDPELSGVPRETTSEPSSSSTGAVEDPELAGKPAEHPDTGAPAPDAAGAAGDNAPSRPRDTIWRTVFRSRWGVETDWDRPSQDVYEGTTIAIVEAEQRQSDTLLFSVGLRARHAVGIQKDGSARYELDVEPTSAFVDVTPADGLHLRAGYQTVGLGRFDLFTAVNFLQVYDLRSGPVTMPEAAVIAQPAIRLDLDRFRGFDLQAIYIPFFQPARLDFFGTNYSLVSVLDRSIAQLPADDQTRTDYEALRAGLDALGRSTVTSASRGVLEGFAPPPNFTKPQGALRATTRGAAGELSATVGTALEKLPVVTFRPPPVLNPVAGLADLISVNYGRFYVAALDGAFDAGPFQIGAEATYMAHRTLGITAPPAGVAVADTLTASTTDMAQLGLRAELVEAAGWAAELEAFAAYALSAAPVREWFGMDGGRWWEGVAGGVHFAPEESRFRLELGGGLFTGPSYALFPRAEWEAIRTLYVELGAAFVGGPAPNLLGGTNVALGGLFTDTDQVFVGLRWQP